MFRKTVIRQGELGLVFHRDDLIGFERILQTGHHWLFDPFSRLHVEIVSKKEQWFEHDRRHEILDSGALAGQISVIDLKRDEVAFVWIDGKLERLIDGGKHVMWHDGDDVRIDLRSQREACLIHNELEEIVRSGLLEDKVVVLDLKDNERGLVWVDERFRCIVGPGLSVLWKTVREIRTEVFDARNTRFVHEESAVILRGERADEFLLSHHVAVNHVGVLFVDDRFVEVLQPGMHVFWRGVKSVHVVQVDTRETITDIGGQEIMTSDKVTLRMNALVTWRVTDAQLAVTAVDNVSHAIHREAQLALRAVVGSRDLDALLADKNVVATEMHPMLRDRAAEIGTEIISIGLRDIILPGDMKDLMNKVTEAKKVAEANLIVRREETAAMRSQANTAKLLTDNPTLMRLRELEVLEKIASNSSLKVVLGERSLSERVLNAL